MDCKKVIANYWNLRSSTYTNGVNGFDEEERAVWKQIFENSLSSGERLNVLDVGTGTGFLALLFAEMGHKVTGVEQEIQCLFLHPVHLNAHWKTVGFQIFVSRQHVPLHQSHLLHLCKWKTLYSSNWQ
jgi:2-polyprenyl-3-methyl-5-hydroxy-6-metoxy-1,4-benzoquinol methylase